MIWAHFYICYILHAYNNIVCYNFQHTPLIQRRRKNAINVFKRSKMNLCNKICYGLGGAPYQLTNTVIGFYISVYLLDTAEVSGAPLLHVVNYICFHDKNVYFCESFPCLELVERSRMYVYSLILKMCALYNLL